MPKVQNNGHLSNRFEVQKGVRQGGPASSLLFLLCAEVLAIELRSNQEIKGIPVAEIVNLLGQFADDMDIYSLHDQKSLDYIFDILEKFKDSAGFTVNYDKTQIYRLGSLVGTKSELITARQITWTDGPLSILGICISHDEDQTILLNYNPIVTKIQSILKAWSCRSLSLYGKVIIINSLVASLFVHKMAVLPTIPAAIVKQIEFDLEKFLWNGRKAKIPLKTLQAARSSGGLQLVNLTKKDKAVKVSWIRQLFVNPQLANLAYHIISNELKEDIWRCYLKAEDIGCVFPPGNTGFWRDTFKAWCEYNCSNEENNGFLWFNSEIKANNKPFFWKIPYNRGLKHASQLYEQGHMISIRKAMDDFGLTLMQFNTLCAAIPKSIKQKWNKKPLNGLPPIVIPETKTVYQNLVADGSLLCAKLVAWEQEFGTVIHYQDFLKCFADIQHVTNITKYRSFQYRLLQRAIITNTHLKHWGIVQSNLCTFCNEEKETYLHIFIYCKKVAVVWMDMEERINIYTILHQ